MTVRSVDCGSVARDETSVSISLLIGFCRACKNDKASETMTTLGCVASFFSRSNLVVV